jgi:putative cardiolipin synthase
MLQTLRLPLLLLSLLLAGCASVDFDYPREASSAISADIDGRLAQIIDQRALSHPGESGFYLLSDGIEALSARLVLAKRAQHSIDVQYYLIKKDEIGYAFIGALLHAAERGVRVRLLLDDIFTSGQDPGLVAMQAHPNIEVRLFNPFAYRSLRALNIFSATRLNRRMHNKLFVVDNHVAIIGGRNIASEYFAGRQDFNFGDLDALMIGPVVPETSAMFDAYWNHPKALPAVAVIKQRTDISATNVALRERTAKAISDLRNTPYVDALEDSVQRFVRQDEDVFTWAPYEFIYDSPDKAVRSQAENADSIVTPLRQQVLAAQSELVIASPYFVPLAATIDTMAELGDRGVDVQVITNSLAANNHPIVHSGYAPKRPALLAAGVTLYEFKPDAKISGSRRAGLNAQAGTLHTKAFVVDRKSLFLGSFNWDPRSVFINTEMGVIVHSAELAGDVMERTERNLPKVSYQVRTGPKGELRWHEQLEQGEKIWTHEPHTGWFKRFWVGLAGLLPLDQQL